MDWIADLINIDSIRQPNWLPEKSPFLPRAARDLTRQFKSHAIELRSEFFHCCIFAGNFTSVSVYSYAKPAKSGYKQ